MLAGTLGLATAGCPLEGSSRGRPRGVVLVTADDLGWRDVGAYGLDAIATPALDRLVHEGVAFDRAFDVVSTCSSSRASVATAQYPHTHGVTGLTHRHPDLSLPEGTPTLARQLQAHGWPTALQGKWHLSEAEPGAYGYDAWLETPIDQRIRDVGPALDFLSQHADGPYYLELNFMQTHRDLLDRFLQVEGYEVDPADAAPPAYWALPDWPEIREEVAGYLSQLRFMDALLGQVLDHIDRLGRTDDTLVVFLSDNGPPFPGCKLTLYDRGVGTPLMFRWPGGLPPAWHDDLVSTVQIAPTVLELVGAPPLPGAQGDSLAGRLLGRTGPVAAEVHAEMESHIEPHPARSVRTARHKYIRNLDPTPWGPGDGGGDHVDALAQVPGQTWDEPRPAEELYDLVTDPLEQDNRIDDPTLAGVRADLRARLLAHAARTDDPRAASL